MYGTSMPAAAWVAPWPAARESSSVTDGAARRQLVGDGGADHAGPDDRDVAFAHNPLSSHAAWCSLDRTPPAGRGHCGGRNGAEKPVFSGRFRVPGSGYGPC